MFEPVEPKKYGALLGTSSITSSWSVLTLEVTMELDV
jgi:hypothetical protein